MCCCSSGVDHGSVYVVRVLSNMYYTKRTAPFDSLASASIYLSLSVCIVMYFNMCYIDVTVNIECVEMSFTAQIIWPCCWRCHVVHASVTQYPIKLCLLCGLCAWYAWRTKRYICVCVCSTCSADAAGRISSRSKDSHWKQSLIARLTYTQNAYMHSYWYRTWLFSCAYLCVFVCIWMVFYLSATCQTKC